MQTNIALTSVGGGMQTNIALTSVGGGKHLSVCGEKFTGDIFSVYFIFLFTSLLPLLPESNVTVP